MRVVEHFTDQHPARPASAARTGKSGDFLNGFWPVNLDALLNRFFADAEAGADNGFARRACSKAAFAQIREGGVDAVEHDSETLEPVVRELLADMVLNGRRKLVVGKTVKCRKRLPR